MKKERMKTAKSLGLILAMLIGLGEALLVVGSAQALTPVDPSGGCHQ